MAADLPPSAARLEIDCPERLGRRYGLRVQAYFGLLVTDQCPPFSLH